LAQVNAARSITTVSCRQECEFSLVSGPRLSATESGRVVQKQTLHSHLRGLAVPVQCQCPGYFSHHSGVPRYRVSIDSGRSGTAAKVAIQLNRSCG
jgi:hypothetical protein